MEGTREIRNLTLNCFIVATRYGHIGNTNKRQRSWMSSRKVLVKPRASLHVAHSATHVVSSLEELIDNVTTNETIHTGDEDGCARSDNDVRLRHLAGCKRTNLLK